MLLLNVLLLGNYFYILNLTSQFNKIIFFARNSIISGIAFTETENAVEAVMDLLDQDLLRDSFFTTEFPMLTSVSRMRNPTADLIKKFKSYLSTKDEKFYYLHKTYLVYSTLIKTFCSSNDCSKYLVSL
jgi:hypothetical protein